MFMWGVKTVTKLILALMILMALTAPAVSDEVDDLVLDLKYGQADVRAAAAISLGGIGDPRAVDPLIVALEDEDELIRSLAAASLGEVGDPRAVGPLIAALKDDDAGVRAGAATALGEIGDVGAVDSLIVAVRDEDWSVRLRSAEALGRLGDSRAVEPLAYLASKDEDARVCEGAVKALGEIGRPAVDALVDLLKLDDLEVRGMAASTLADIGDLRAVDPLIEAHEYDEAIRLENGSALAWAGRGLALYGQGRYEEAILSFDAAIRLDNESALAWVGKGLALYDLKRYDEAILAYDEAIRLEPEYPDAWYNKGIALRNLGRCDEAIEAYDVAIRLDPEDADVWNNRGVALYDLKRYDEAISAYDEAISLDPGYGRTGITGGSPSTTRESTTRRSWLTTRRSGSIQGTLTPGRTKARLSRLLAGALRRRPPMPSPGSWGCRGREVGSACGFVIWKGGEYGEETSNHMASRRSRHRHPICGDLLLFGEGRCVARFG